MKRTYTLIVAASLITGSAFGQGSVLLNNYDSGKGVFLGTAAAPAGTFVEVLGGPAQTSLTPVATAASVNKYTITAADLNANGPNTGSFFDYGTGFTTGVAAWSGTGAAPTGFFQVRAWSGAATYDLALTRGSSSIFSNPVGTNPAAPGIPVGMALQIPGNIVMTVVPEPSVIVLGVLGVAALLFRRRK